LKIYNNNAFTTRLNVTSPTENKEANNIVDLLEKFKYEFIESDKGGRPFIIVNNPKPAHLVIELNNLRPDMKETWKPRLENWKPFLIAKSTIDLAKGVMIIDRAIKPILKENREGDIVIIKSMKLESFNFEMFTVDRNGLIKCWFSKVECLKNALNESIMDELSYSWDEITNNIKQQQVIFSNNSYLTQASLSQQGGEVNKRIMLIDTGANMTSFRLSLIEQSLFLYRGTTQVVVANNNTVIYPKFLGLVTIEAIVKPLEFLSGDSNLLGMDFLSQVNININNNQFVISNR
jgi:predicted aspartyl protease